MVLGGNSRAGEMENLVEVRQLELFEQVHAFLLEIGLFISNIDDDLFILIRKLDAFKVVLL